MNILFPQNGWLAWLLLIAVWVGAFLIAGFTGWLWLWSYLFYVLGGYILVRAIYIYWPRKGAQGGRNKTSGILFLGIGIFGLLSMVAMVIFHIGPDDRAALTADGIGSLMFLAFGALNVLGVAAQSSASEEKKFPPLEP